MSDEQLVDFLEGELGAYSEKDIELLLKNSGPDRLALEGLQQTRELVENADDVVLPEDGHYFSSLEERILSALDKEKTNDGVMLEAERSVKKFKQLLFRDSFLKR